ncbi:hypothetical protein [Brochothrix thermosphacta]|uniref:Uncharacterized protein n=1 Tax=Brochothrix thermosphacta TaxID=2756 RepID=A0A2X0QLE9_BROTH|nr:hypothetical protein [Brochothrix thermosphacta]SPP29406.1 hypothetical protein BTBSAS_50054 [Brochothrix thermosphacta]
MSVVTKKIQTLNSVDFTNVYNQSIKENRNPMERGKFTGSAKISGKALITVIV